ncbi:MAG: Unknown protein [uncultured Sulfurovum sp.]|uniref:Uncharacterized protein n=1 Tax=uncultured Sulfurovum sp. TaxID=269237 RepID=A0A6S6U3E8_9BACT|nr:MAG: Unknown protein [uncultured Sulfurovum sp.]
MKHFTQIKIIAILITLCFQPLLMAKITEVSQNSYTETIQISKSDMLIDILVAISHSLRAVTTTSKELNSSEEKETNWFIVGLVIMVALASILAVFQSDEE